MLNTYVQFLELTKHLGHSDSKDIDNRFLSISVFPPYVDMKNSIWDKTTILHYNFPPEYPFELHIEIDDNDDHILVIRMFLPKDFQDGTNSDEELAKSTEDFINEMLSRLNLSKWKFNDFSVRTVGYTIGFEFDSSKTAVEYFELIKKSNNNSKFSPVSTIHIPPTIICYHDSGKTYMSLVVEKMLDQYKELNPHVEKEDVKGILKFEFGCYKRDINSIIERYLPDKKDFNYTDRDVCVAVTKKCINELCCSGDYYKYDEAISRIKKSNLSQENITLMLEMLELMYDNEIGLYDTTCTLLHKDYSSEQIEEAISKINELNVNPVVIPDGKKINEIPNLLKLL